MADDFEKFRKQQSKILDNRTAEFGGSLNKKDPGAYMQGLADLEAERRKRKAEREKKAKAAEGGLLDIPFKKGGLVKAKRKVTKPAKRKK